MLEKGPAAVVLMPTGCLPMDVFWGCPTGRDLMTDPELDGGITQYIPSGLGTSCDAPGEAAADKVVWNILLRPLSLRPDTRKV